MAVALDFYLRMMNGNKDQIGIGVGDGNTKLLWRAGAPLLLLITDENSQANGDMAYLKVGV